MSQVWTAVLPTLRQMQVVNVLVDGCAEFHRQQRIICDDAGNRKLTILLVISVAGRFHCSAAAALPSFASFSVVSDQPISEVFSGRISVIYLRASAALLFAHHSALRHSRRVIFRPFKVSLRVSVMLRSAANAEGNEGTFK